MAIQTGFPHPSGSLSDADGAMGRGKAGQPLSERQVLQTAYFAFLATFGTRKRACGGVAFNSSALAYATGFLWLQSYVYGGVVHIILTPFY